MLNSQNNNLYEYQNFLDQNNLVENLNQNPPRTLVEVVRTNNNQNGTKLEQQDFRDFLNSQNNINNNNQSRPLNKNENREDLNQNRDSDENNLGILNREDFQKLDEDDPFIHEDQNGDRIGNFYEDMDMSIVEVNNSLRSYQLSENQPPELLIYVKKISKTEITREFTKKK